jgi:hypothetical protein
MYTKHLGQAVIARAINDLNSNKPDIRQSAISFLFEDAGYKCLSWWAMLAELNPEQLRIQLRKRKYI